MAHDFDQFIANAVPFYQGDSKTVKKFRETMFPKWVPRNSAFVAKAMSTYAEYRENGTDHPKAKTVTLNWFSQAVAG